MNICFCDFLGCFCVARRMHSFYFVDALVLFFMLGQRWATMHQNQQRQRAIQSKQMHIVNVCQFYIHTVYIQIQAAFQSIFGRRASICERIMKFYLEKQWKIRWISNVTHSRKYSPGWASCKVEWCTEHFNRSPCITQPFIRLLQN